MNWPACVLCGVVSHDVTPGLIAWRTPIGRDKYTWGPRCKDVDDCRGRALEQGEEWDVEVSSWQPEPERKQTGPPLIDTLLGLVLLVLVVLGSQR